MRFLSTLVILLNIGVVSAKAPFVPTSPLAKQLQVRGGAGPLDPNIATQVMTVAALGQGFFSMQAPEKCLEVYGTADKSLSVQAPMSLMGAGILAIGVTGFCLFFMDTSVHKAIGWSLVPWVAEHSRALLDQRDSKLGGSPMGRWLWLALTLFDIHACFTGADYTDTAIKVSSALLAANCAFSVIDPASCAAIYGQKNLSQDALTWVRASGFEILAYCVLLTALASGVESKQALGYMSVPVIAHTFSHLFITKEVEKGNVVGPLMYFWLFFHLTSMVTLAFPESSPVTVTD